MSFPRDRMRRLRRSETLRRMVRETRLSRDDLVLQESQKAAVTDDEVNAFYAQNKDRMGGATLEQIGPRIRRHLEQQAGQSSMQKLISDLRQRAAVQVSFSAPGNPSFPSNVFQLDAAGVGTADFDLVDATIASDTTIVGVTPICRATIDFVPVVRIHFEDGTIAPVTTTFTWEAPPIITNVTNLDSGTGNGVDLPLAAGQEVEHLKVLAAVHDDPLEAELPIILREAP